MRDLQRNRTRAWSKWAHDASSAGGAVLGMFKEEDIELTDIDRIISQLCQAASTTFDEFRATTDDDPYGIWQRLDLRGKFDDMLNRITHCSKALRCAILEKDEPEREANIEE